MALTKKQKAVYDYIKDFTLKYGLAPTQKEIKEYFKLKSFGSVQRYLKYLIEEGLLESDFNARRGIKIKNDPTQLAHAHIEGKIQIPLLGNVAAGNPIEAIEQCDNFISVDPKLIKVGAPHFALKVQGDSMIEDGILENDLLVIRHQNQANQGQIVVAIVEGEATVKHFIKKTHQIELHPANVNYEPIIIQDGNFSLAGIVVGLIRSYI